MEVSELVRRNRQDELDRWKDTLGGDWACQREREIIWEPLWKPV